MTLAFLPRTRFCGTALAMLAALAVAMPAGAQSNPVTTPIPYTIGSSNSASADAPVQRPGTTPCIVNLYTADLFANPNFGGPGTQPFTYAPPSSCPGPWSKVVLVGDYYITAGIQYDRTSQIFFNGVNIYFGTTPEPTSATANTTWHFENDLTDYSSMFTTTGSGYASLYNPTVVDGLTGSIYGTASLYFYPASSSYPAPTTADVVYALPSGGGATTVNSSGPSFTTTLTLPTNMKNLYIDVVSQSQNEEEQWFYCLPNDIAGEFDDCGNTNFRETDITIDGVPAGAGPISSWIYTGGLDPYLWFPIPGNQTLNLKAYRIDLSPFAGALSDGNPHTIGVGVLNAFEYFTETASLLVYEDHGSTTTGGSVTTNTLTVPTANVVEDVSTDSSGDTGGYVYTTSKHSYSISGTVNTSAGTITNSVSGNLDFSNTTYLYESGDGNVYTQNADSTYTAEQVSTSAGKTSVRKWSYPLNLALTDTYDPDTEILDQVTTVTQGFSQTYPALQGLFGSSTASYTDSNVVTSADTLVLNYAEGVESNENQSTTQTYLQSAPGYCYYQTLSAANNVLTGFSGKSNCVENPDATVSSNKTAPKKFVDNKNAHPTVPVGPVAKKAAARRQKLVAPKVTASKLTAPK